MATETVYKSLLDCWTPPQTTTDIDSNPNPIPIAFITTTFTFDAEFFDEECLTRFLTMETEKENDGVAFLIEREEKLAGLHAGIVLVDQNSCRGERSLRWDLVPCRVKNGIMHAKISILHWSHCIRLIIGSANLTQNGCCINQEIFGVIDYYSDGDADMKVINEILVYLQSLVNEQCGDVVKGRFNRLQAGIKQALRKWNVTETQYKKDEVSLQLLLVSPKEKEALIKFRGIWDNHSVSPPDSVFITSPFFDTEESPNTPSIRIFDILKQRGKVEVVYNVTTELLSDASGEILVNAPDFLRKTLKPDTQSVSFSEVNETGINEDGKTVPRPLHLKSIWLSNDDIQLYLVGSSNFTTAALGLGNRTNYEANLVYAVSKNRNKKANDLMVESYLKTTDLDKDLLKFRQRINEDEETLEDDYLNLPLCFGEAVIFKNQEKYQFDLNFNTTNLPAGFEIYDVDKSAANGSGKCILNEEQWNLNGSPLKITIDCNENTIPDYLLVSWNDSKGKAFWPIIVDSQITLPPVESLRNLPLEALLQILSSSQPLHRLLKIIEKAASKNSHSKIDETIIDAHRLVNTTGFLLQRTRRVSYAMKALRNRLEKPVFTNESLTWRLYGPIGVNSLIEAIINEAKTEEEKRFLLAELALELSRIQPQITDVSLKQSEIKAAIKEVVKKLATDIESKDITDNTAIEIYSKKAIQKAINEL